MRDEAIANYNLASESNRDEWARRLGPLFHATLADVRNRATMPRGMRLQAQDINTDAPGRPPPAQIAIIQDEVEANEVGHFIGNEGHIGSARDQDESQGHKQDNKETYEDNMEVAGAFERAMT